MPRTVWSRLLSLSDVLRSRDLTASSRACYGFEGSLLPSLPPMQPRNIPKGTFLVGAFCGLVLGIPLLALCVSLYEPGVPLSLILLHAAGFAGIPALVTAGGVARWVARKLADPITIG